LTAFIVARALGCPSDVWLGKGIEAPVLLEMARRTIGGHGRTPEGISCYETKETVMEPEWRPSYSRPIEESDPTSKRHEGSEQRERKIEDGYIQKKGYDVA
jgi:hypothetical protein